MKKCPECGRIYSDVTQNYCLDDGARLVAAIDGGVSDEAATAVMSLSSGASGRFLSEPIQQDIQFCKTDDGLQIAYSVIGDGPLLLRVLGHFTHLEMEWEWPDLRHLWERLAERFTVVRYDGRGIGLSEKYDGEFTEETRQSDLDAVLKAVDASKATLLGISKGGWTSAQYATTHAESISRLILYGSYCRGATARPDYDVEEDEALVTLIRKGWGRDTPAFRQVFTAAFFQTNADPKLLAHFNNMQRASADGQTAARYWKSIHLRGDGREIFRKINVPTLVIHCQDDMAVDADEGRLLAATIPGARLVLLPSGTHYFPTDSDVINKVVGAITRFMDE
jgi:pimeloyl-ACP methyl ester carboxylesterase